MFLSTGGAGEVRSIKYKVLRIKYGKGGVLEIDVDVVASLPAHTTGRIIFVEKGNDTAAVGGSGVKRVSTSFIRREVKIQTSAAGRVSWFMTIRGTGTA